MDGVLVPWVVATTILLFVAAYWIYTLEKRLGQFQARYKNLLEIAEAVESAPDQAALLPLVRQLEGHEARLSQTESGLRTIHAKMPHVLRRVGIVRYNAFEGVGGDQSFSIAMVDGEGHGAVLTGLHSGDEVRVYAKPLENWRSSYSLSADEQRALGEARGADQTAG